LSAWLLSREFFDTHQLAFSQTLVDAAYAGDQETNL